MYPRTRDWLVLEDDLVCPNRVVTHSRLLPRAVFYRVLNVSEDGSFSFCWQPYPVFNFPYNKNCFLIFTKNFMFQLVPIVLHPVTGTTGAWVLPYTPHQVAVSIDKICTETSSDQTIPGLSGLSCSMSNIINILKTKINYLNIEPMFKCLLNQE